MFHYKNIIGKKNEKNNVTIFLNVLYAEKGKIYPASVSKHNWNNEKRVLLLMTPNWEKREAKPEGWCHYLAVKILPALSRGITSKHCHDFYCVNCLYSFWTKSKLESHKRVCENKDFCNIICLLRVLKY